MSNDKSDEAMTPKLLPTMIPGDDEDPPVDPLEIISMSLPLGADEMLLRRGRTLQDGLDGKVPEFDPEKILEAAAHENDPDWKPDEAPH